MENEFLSDYDDPEEPIITDKETNGCLAMLITFAVLAVVLCAWGFYALLKF